MATVKAPLLKQDPSQTSWLRKQLLVKVLLGYSLLKKSIARAMIAMRHEGDLLVNEEVKPSSCTCPNWPRVKLRNGSTHFPECPVHKEWLAAGGFNRVTTNALPGSPSRLKTFRSWLRKQMDVDLVGNDVIEEYIRRAYVQGAKRARRQSTRRFSPAVERGRDLEFSRSFLQGPSAVATVKLLASRTYSELEGITARMATKINAILIDGLLQNKSYDEMTQSMVNAVDIEESRAKAIVVTELVRTQARGQLESFAHNGITQVEADVEWEASPTACPYCSSMAGKVFTIVEAMGLIPAHVSCHCGWSIARRRR